MIIPPGEEGKFADRCVYAQCCQSGKSALGTGDFSLMTLEERKVR